MRTSGPSPVPELPRYASLVLDVVDLVPIGQVTTYGDVAAYLGEGGPRQVGTVLARYGALVTWWRVVDASGRLPVRHAVDALPRWQAEGTPLASADPPRVDLARARWQPPGAVDVG